MFKYVNYLEAEIIVHWFNQLLMKYLHPFLLLLLLNVPSPIVAQSSEIMLVATDHFQQIYKKDNSNTDIFTDKRQKEITESSRLLAQFKPDLIMVEREPEQQAELDSLYRLYTAQRLDLKILPQGRDEIYQIAFRLGKNLGLKRIFGVNAPGGSSQSMLSNGANISLYKDSTTVLRKVVAEKYRQIADGSLSFTDYLRFLNSPQAYNKIYRLRYITPARVTDGYFDNPDKMVDTAFINPKYIGAELSALFKNRDYKIYSNIVVTAMKEKPRRILLLIGTGHIGSLRSIIRDDPEFRIVETLDYLK